MEQERQLRFKLSNRAGVLALMLHSTFNHELMEQMTAQQQAQEQAQQHQALENGSAQKNKLSSDHKMEIEDEDGGSD